MNWSSTSWRAFYPCWSNYYSVNNYIIIKLLQQLCSPHLKKTEHKCLTKAVVLPSSLRVCSAVLSTFVRYWRNSSHANCCLLSSIKMEAARLATRGPKINAKLVQNGKFFASVVLVYHTKMRYIFNRECDSYQVIDSYIATSMWFISSYWYIATSMWFISSYWYKATSMWIISSYWYIATSMWFISSYWYIATSMWFISSYWYIATSMWFISSYWYIATSMWFISIYWYIATSMWFITSYWYIASYIYVIYSVIVAQTEVIERIFSPAIIDLVSAIFSSAFIVFSKAVTRVSKPLRSSAVRGVLLVALAKYSRPCRINSKLSSNLRCAMAWSKSSGSSCTQVGAWGTEGTDGWVLAAQWEKGLLMLSSSSSSLMLTCSFTDPVREFVAVNSSPVLP